MNSLQKYLTEMDGCDNLFPAKSRADFTFPTLPQNFVKKYPHHANPNSDPGWLRKKKEYHMKE